VEAHDKTERMQVGVKSAIARDPREWSDLTLKLDICCKRSGLVCDKRPLLWYVVVRERPSRGEGRKVKRGQDWSWLSVGAYGDNGETNDLLLMTVTSWVASTYRERPSRGNVIGLSSIVELVVELC
jgi:hypothetical protein